MDRREAVKSVAFLIGGALSATTIATLFDSCNEPGKNGDKLFTDDHQKLVTELADIIIPTTAKSPGAKAANVGPFITMMIKDCYPQDAQEAFVKGLNDLENRSKKEFKKSFLNILFLKIFGNQNADCLYEVLTFQIDENTNAFKYGRIVTEELSRESIKYNTPNSLKMFDGELLFENQNYSYRTTNFKSNLLDLWVARTNKKTDEIDNLVYNTLIFR